MAAADPAGGRALWLRCTALKLAGKAARPTTWLTFFDRSAARGPRALRVTASDGLGHPGEAWARSSLGEMGPSGACGEMDDSSSAGGLTQAAWDLRWQPRTGELAYLPARWLYDRPIPRSNGAALMPAGTVSGAVMLDGAEVVIERWEAMVGHNWGAEHPHQWCWMHAGGLGDDGRGWLDLALVRIAVGPVVTPWIASGALELEGRRHAPAPLRHVTCERAGERTSVRVPLAAGGAVALEIAAPQRATVTWDYASPRGPGRRVENCSVADAALSVTSAGATRSLAVTGTAAVEHGRVP